VGQGTQMPNRTLDWAHWYRGGRGAAGMLVAGAPRRAARPGVEAPRGRGAGKSGAPAPRACCGRRAGAGANAAGGDTRGARSHEERGPANRLGWCSCPRARGPPGRRRRGRAWNSGERHACRRAGAAAQRLAPRRLRECWGVVEESVQQRQAGAQRKPKGSQARGLRGAGAAATGQVLPGTRALVRGGPTGLGWRRQGRRRGGGAAGAAATGQVLPRTRALVRGGPTGLGWRRLGGRRGGGAHSAGGRLTGPGRRSNASPGGGRATAGRALVNGVWGVCHWGCCPNLGLRGTTYRADPTPPPHARGARRAAAGGGARGGRRARGAAAAIRGVHINIVPGSDPQRDPEGSPPEFSIQKRPGPAPRARKCRARGRGRGAPRGAGGARAPWAGAAAQRRWGAPRRAPPGFGVFRRLVGHARAAPSGRVGAAPRRAAWKRFGGAGCAGSERETAPGRSAGPGRAGGGRVREDSPCQV
jgi:hypothetical protein